MTCCEEEQRGTRPHAVDLSSASESGTYAGTGTQALRVVIAFGVDELTNPYDMSGIEVLEDKEKVLTVLKEMQTPVLLFALIKSILKITNNFTISVTFFYF